MLKTISKELIDKFTESLSAAYKAGFSDGRARARMDFENDFKTHFGLPIDSKLSDIPTERESLKAKLDKSPMTIGNLVSNTKEQVAKKFKLSLGDLLELVDVLAQFNYSFSRDDIPF